MRHTAGSTSLSSIKVNKKFLHDFFSGVCYCIKCPLLILLLRIDLSEQVCVCTILNGW